MDREIRSSVRGASVREAVHEWLRRRGMSTVFGNPGSTELGFLENWPADFRYVLGLNEGAVVAMADGYAQATRSAAFVNLHSAGGLGHALTSVLTAWWNQTPLVLVAGQQTRSLLTAMPYLYAADATAFPRPYVKWAVEPARAADVPAALERARHIALERPMGPVFVSVPQDDWNAEAEAVEPREVAAEFGPDPVMLRQVAEALNSSRNPALVVGPAVDRDGAWDLMVELAERTRAPVWVSPYSSRCSFPEDHRLFAGFLPPAREPLSRKLAGHDVIVVFGAPVFTYHLETGGEVIPPGARLYQLIDDPQMAAASLTGTSLLTTMRPAIAELIRQTAPAKRPDPEPFARPKIPLAGEPISTAFLFHTLASVMPHGAIVVEETATARPVMHDYLPVRMSGGFYAGASGALGWALPAAVGVALGRPGQRVVCVVGDGASHYTIQGLWTAAQHQLPITFVIFNNGSYAAMEEFGRHLGGSKRYPDFTLPGIDYVQLAAGYLVKGRRVERARDLAAAFEESFATAAPMLLDVPIDPAVPPLF
jgi:benzoylformate decarboxylase